MPQKSHSFPSENATQKGLPTSHAEKFDTKKSPSALNQPPSTFLNIFPIGPRSCTKADLRTLQKQRLFDIASDEESSMEMGVTNEDPRVDEKGLTLVKGKKKKNEVS